MSSTQDIMQRSLKRRYSAERRFRMYGLLSILVAMLFLVFLFGSIISNGYSGFQQTRLLLPLTLSTEHFEATSGSEDITEALRAANYSGIVKDAVRDMFPHVTKRGEKRALTRLVSPGAADILRRMVMEDPELVGSSMEIWLPVDDDVDMYIKGHFNEKDSAYGRLSEQQAGWVDGLLADGKIKGFFNTGFFTTGDSREPELAGIGGALMGTFLTLIITLILSFPIGVGAAVYLEEFAPKNRWTDLIEVNINNLAAVPSIVFGLLGLAVFINFFGTPRSAPITGGFVLTLMTLPTIIISSRAVLKSVPPSIREAALGVGASRVQMMFHHVLPQALPGMLTGTIIGMSQALGESAPLLMIGMVAFIVDVPAGFFDPSTVLPVQIFLWADSPERAFVEKTSAAIIVLLGFLVLMNATAIYLRKKYEKQW